MGLVQKCHFHWELQGWSRIHFQLPWEINRGAYTCKHRFNETFKFQHFHFPGFHAFLLRKITSNNWERRALCQTPVYSDLRNQFPVQNTETIIIKLQPSSVAQKSAYQGEMGFFAVYPQPPHGMRKSTLQPLVTKRLTKGALPSPDIGQAKCNCGSIRSFLHESWRPKLRFVQMGLLQ